MFWESVSSEKTSESNGKPATKAPVDPFVTPLAERLDTLIDGIATANRAALAHATELRRMRTTVLIAGLFLAILYMKGY